MDADSVRYKKVEGQVGGLPFVLEVAFGIYTDEYEGCGRDISVGLNWSATLKPPIRELVGLLGEQRVDPHDPVVVLVHLACPADAVHRPRQGRAAAAREAEEDAPDQLDCPTDGAEVGLEGLEAGEAQCRPAGPRPASRPREDAQRCAIGRPRSRTPPTRHMEVAYLKASANGTLPANARQIMYAARPYVLAEAGECWRDSSYFTQTLLPDYMEEYGIDDWNVVFDARGHLREAARRRARRPGDHRGTPLHRVLERCRRCDDLDPASHDRHALPHGRARQPLPLRPVRREGRLRSRSWQAARIAERFDIAIMSTKGMSMTAARALVEQLSERGVTILVRARLRQGRLLHPAHAALQHPPLPLRGAPERRRPRPAPQDVEAMELQSEPVRVHGRPRPALEPARLRRQRRGV